MIQNPVRVASLSQPGSNDWVLVFADAFTSRESPREALRRLALATWAATTVLIRGEAGSGRKFLARILQERSPRSHHVMVKIDCCAIPAARIDEVLFGDAADADNAGASALRLAEGGTLLLDEVGALPLATQVKLSQVLEARTAPHTSDAQSVSAAARVVATTSRDLAADALAGRFDSGLLRILNACSVEVPPLRTRPEDVAMLAEHFMRRMASRLGRPLRRIDPDTLARLQAHRWPGNVRELQAVIERAAVQASGDTLVVDWALEAGASVTSTPSADTAGDAAANAEVLTLQEVERRHIIAVLKRTRGVIEGPKGAARLLNLKPSTARFRMKKLGISRTDYVSST